MIPSDVVSTAVPVGGGTRRCVEHAGEQSTVLALALSRGKIRRCAYDLRCASLLGRLLLCDAVQHGLGESCLRVDQRRRSNFRFLCFVFVAGVTLGRRMDGMSCLSTWTLLKGEPG